MFADNSTQAQQFPGQPNPTDSVLKTSRLPIIIAALGLIIFFISAATFSFRNTLFTNLFLKPPSKAGGGAQDIFVIDSLGNSVTRVSSKEVEVELIPPNWSSGAGPISAPINTVATESAILAEDERFRINKQEYGYEQFRASTVIYTFLEDSSNRTKSLYAKFTSTTGLAQNANPFPLSIDIVEASRSGSPSASPRRPKRKADLNDDDRIDVFDVRVLFNNWGKHLASVSDGDMDRNFVINSFDFAVLIRDLDD